MDVLYCTQFVEFWSKEEWHGVEPDFRLIETGCEGQGVYSPNVLYADGGRTYRFDK